MRRKTPRGTVGLPTQLPDKTIHCRRYPYTAPGTLERKLPFLRYRGCVSSLERSYSPAMEGTTGSTIYLHSQPPPGSPAFPNTNTLLVLSIGRASSAMAPEFPTQPKESANSSNQSALFSSPLGPPLTKRLKHMRSFVSSSRRSPLPRSPSVFRIA